MLISNDRADEMVNELATYNVNLTNWENKFVQDMGEQEGCETYTDPEKEKILEIYTKYLG